MMAMACMWINGKDLFVSFFCSNGTNECSDLFVEWKKNSVDHLSPFVQIEPVN